MVPVPASPDQGHYVRRVTEAGQAPACIKTSSAGHWRADPNNSCIRVHGPVDPPRRDSGIQQLQESIPRPSHG